MRKRPSLAMLVPAYGLIAHIYAYVSVPGFPLSQNPTAIVALFVVLGSSVCLLGETLVRSSFSYRIVLGAHLVMLLVGHNAIGTNAVAELALVSTVLVSIAFYEDYPRNLVVCLVYTVCHGLIGLSGLSGYDVHASVSKSIGVSVVLFLISVLSCHLTMLRQSLIDVQLHGTRLEQAIGTLTRANQEYQDYVLRIGAESTERERKRITRDIHDIVGYTLTNNIMLMEAATDAVRSDPIKVTKLLSTARESAQEGLERIRESLHWFRQNRNFAPYGLSAIAKLVETFQLATGIEVNVDYTNTPITIGGDIDSAIYHAVQESMVNALRHGRATKIALLLMYREGSKVLIEIRDNGKVSDEKTSSETGGIGLTGMAERISRLGGTLQYGSVAGGFQVSANIPLSIGTENNGE